MKKILIGIFLLVTIHSIKSGDQISPQQELHLALQAQDVAATRKALQCGADPMKKLPGLFSTHTLCNIATEEMLNAICETGKFDVKKALQALTREDWFLFFGGNYGYKRNPNEGKRIRLFGAFVADISAPELIKCTYVHTLLRLTRFMDAADTQLYENYLDMFANSGLNEREAQNTLMWAQGRHHKILASYIAQGKFKKNPVFFAKVS